MPLRVVSVSACVTSLMAGLAIQPVYAEIAPYTNALSEIAASYSSRQLSLKQARNRAQAITVKVLVGQTWGSGVLIQKEGQLYTVVTNEHVVSIGKNYRIQTPDGKIYSASKDTAAKFNGNDLALLNFRSKKSYQVATLGNYSALDIGDKTFAAGFPNEDEVKKGFVFTTGQIASLLPQPFEDGYQLGYSNDILKGMSGGPVLNIYGEVVAINGKHKYPLWGSPYIFKDGSTPSNTESEQMELLSWAVPVEAFLQQGSNFSSSAISTPKVESSYPVISIPDDTTVEPIFPEGNPGNEAGYTEPLW